MTFSIVFFNEKFQILESSTVITFIAFFCSGFLLSLRRFFSLFAFLISDDKHFQRKNVVCFFSKMKQSFLVFEPFKRQPHKMVKHNQTIRRLLALKGLRKG